MAFPARVIKSGRFVTLGSPRFLGNVCVFSVGVALMQVLYAGSVPHPGADIGAPETDSFYHIAMARMLPQYGTLREFPWLQYVWFRDQGREFVSHHHGFHLLLWPFVALAEYLTGDPLRGGRWAMSFFMGLNLLLFHLLLRRLNVPWHWLWVSLFFILPDQFFARHGFVRAIGPSLAFMLLLLNLLFAGRFAWAAVVTAGFVHLYLGAVFYGPLIALTYAFAQFAAGRGPRDRPGRMLGLAALGWWTGVLSYPYAEGMFEFLRMQVLSSGLAPSVDVGREWRPYGDPWFLVQMAGPLFAVWTTALLARLRAGIRLDAQELTLFLLQVGFLLLTLKARRFVEYWPPLCLLSAACLAAPAIHAFNQTLNMTWKRRPRKRQVVALLSGASAVCLIGLVVPVARAGLRSASGQLRCRYDLPALRGALEFVARDSRPGDIVFTDDWDVFPAFFYYNQKNYYVVGLDPEFTHRREPELWERFVRISRGETPAPLLGQDGNRGMIELSDARDVFKARYVVTDRDHTRLAMGLACATTLAELVYPQSDFASAKDAPYLVFRIRDPATVSSAPAPRDEGATIPLSEITPESAEQGWGTLSFNKSVAGQPLQACSRRYTSGLGTHAAARLEFPVPAGAVGFRAQVGIDDEVLGRGTAIASVAVDGKEMFRSSTLRGGAAPESVDIPLEMARSLVLRVDTTPDGPQYDHVDWLEARFIIALDAGESPIGGGICDADGDLIER